EEDPLLVQLDPEDDGTTRLVLRHTALLDAEEFARTGPGSLALGWELALLALAAHTDGWHASCLVPVPSPGPDWLHGPEGGTYVPGRGAGRRRPSRPGSTRPRPGRGRAISSGATSAPDDRPARPARLLRHVRTAELFAPAHHLLTDSLGDHPGSALPVPGPGHPGAGAAGAGALRLRAHPAGVRGTVRADA